jgi:AraC-like DNA-binding protein
MAQSLAARGVPVLEASFMHPEPPGQLAAYRRCFRSRCFFSHPSNSLLLAEDVLAWPVQAVNILAGVKPANCTRKFSLASLQQFLVLALARGDFQLAHAAAYFHLSSRTLQRRLSQQGVAYQPLLKQQRLRLAEDYLLYSDMGLQEISQLLGFKEQSSFNHFFMAARGVTPTAFRLGG